MKTIRITRIALLCTALAAPSLTADPATRPTAKKAAAETPAEVLARHAKGAKKLAGEQDNLSADVQDLIDEQTNPKVIELLRAVETIMADATDQLENKDTGGATIATQTEVIEKIFEAAKKKQQQGQGQGQQQQGMMEMLKNMMEGGKDLGQGNKPGQPGDKPGQGGGGGGDGEAGGSSGDPDNTARGGQRRVPKNSGNSGSSLPREFQKAMDAYNKGAAAKSNQR